MSGSILSQEYWNDRYGESNLTYNETQVHFKELFARYLKPGGTCFEIGCYPGRYLIYLGITFAYLVNGIDATPNTVLLADFISSYHVKVGQIVQGDFLTYPLASEKNKASEKYDLVCSFGFIEHFINYEEIILRHIHLVKPGGLLIISCPNFRGLQTWFHRLIDPVNLARHYLKAMNLAKWRKTLLSNNMQILYHGYYHTAGFWYDTPRQGFWVTPAIKLVDWVTKKIDQHINWPNPLLSPHMISISQKPI